jgi:hypothetical protein
MYSCSREHIAKLWSRQSNFGWPGTFCDLVGQYVSMCSGAHRQNVVGNIKLQMRHLLFLFARMHHSFMFSRAHPLALFCR